MHEHIVPVSKSPDTGSVLNNLTITWTFDTIWSVALKMSSHSVPNKLSSLSESDSELRFGHRMSIITS